MTAPPASLGVSIDGFAVEGGFDTESGPASSFCAAQSLGKVPASLRSAGTYEHLADLIRHAAALGVDEVRLTMEWARLERRPDERDHEALEHYLSALRVARDEGLRCVVVLCDAALPSWFGGEPWLAAWAPPRFAAHAAWVASGLDGLAETIVTFRCPNTAVREGWLTGTRPPFRRDANDDAVCALDGILVSHQRACEAIAEVAPQLTRALLFEAAHAYDRDGAWRDLAAGVVDPVLLSARRDRWEHDGSRAPRRRGFSPVGANLRSSSRWRDTPSFEWWLASDDAELLARALAFAEGTVQTVELGASVAWSDDLRPRVTQVASHGATTVHLHGLVGSTGPLAAPIGVLDVDQHNGAWLVRDTAPGAEAVRALCAS